MNNVFGDSQFWKNVGKNVVDLPQDFINKLSRFGEIPSEASDIADQKFPNSARDASTKNAFRHALGTGLIAQELGASQGGVVGTLGAGLAKVSGYAWEGLGLNQWNDPQHRNDSKHDLNANALGAKTAQGKDKVQLIEALQKMAEQSQVQQPPGVFEASPGHMTRTVR